MFRLPGSVDNFLIKNANLRVKGYYKSTAKNDKLKLKIQEFY